GHVYRELSPPEAHVTVHRSGVGGRIGDAVDLVGLIILQDEVAAVVAELHTASVERHDRRSAGGNLGVELRHAAGAVNQLPPVHGLRCGSAVTQHDRFKARVTTGRVDQGTL